MKIVWSIRGLQRTPSSKSLSQNRERSNTQQNENTTLHLPFNPSSDPSQNQRLNSTSF